MVNTIQSGSEAEQAVCNYLKKRFFNIRNVNWRTPLCEIDIVAKKSNTIYFVEVKYRSTTNHGNGFDYITPAKLKKMTFAAELWISAHNWNGDWRLMAAAVTKSTKNIELVEI